MFIILVNHVVMNVDFMQHFKKFQLALYMYFTDSALSSLDNYSISFIIQNILI